MERYLGDFCGEVNGHWFVEEFLVNPRRPNEKLRLAYGHARFCGDCRTGIQVALAEHCTGNSTFSYKSVESIFTILNNR